jgi:hypothetical protein
MSHLISRRGRSPETYPSPPVAGGSGGPPTGPAGGDLDGTYPDPGVAALQGNALGFDALGPSEDGFVLTWVNADGELEMLAPTGGSPSGSAGGDLGGTYPDPTVGNLQGNTLTLGALGAGQDGFVLTWVNADGQLEMQAIPTQPASGPAGGDLTGDYPDPTVDALESNPLNLGTLGAGQDGFVLTWVNGDNALEMQAIPTQPASGPAGGDLSGTYPDPTVSAIDNSPLNLSDPATGDVLLFDGTNWVNSQSLQELIATVAALQEQVTNLSNGQGFNLSDEGSGPVPNMRYDGTQIFFVTT